MYGFRREPYPKKQWPKKSLGDLKKEDLNGKKVLVRLHLDFKIDEKTRVISGDLKIRKSLPTINYLREAGAKLILASHATVTHARDFPCEYEEMYSMKTIWPKLSELWGFDVELANNCIGQNVVRLVDEIPEGGTLLLENLRFNEKEYIRDPGFAEQLANLADLYVSEALGIAHIPSASTETILKYIQPCVAGLLMHKELQLLFEGMADVKKPFAAIVGGSKLSAKIALIEFLLDKVSVLLLGGGLIFTFFRALGHSVGFSLVEESMVGKAKLLLEKAQKQQVRLYYAEDVVVGDEYGADAEPHVVEGSRIPNHTVGLDIGPKAIEKIKEELDKAQTIFWNGPMGVCEYEKFAPGTKAVAEKLVECTAKGKEVIVVGDDTVDAIVKMKLDDKISCVLTGGIAWLELLVGRILPAVVWLDDAPNNA